MQATMAPGALTAFVAPELLQRVFQDAEAYRELLNFEERFDSERSVLGIAASGAGGLALRAARLDAAL